jgi:hypothetical protein
MGHFDMTKAASIITTSPNPILDSLGTAFGIPVCQLDFAKSILNSFPSPVLDSMMGGIESGKQKAIQKTQEIMRAIFNETGIIEYDTNLGRFVWVGSGSGLGIFGSSQKAMDNAFGFGEILGAVGQAWLIGDTLVDQVEGILNCFNQDSAQKALQQGPSGGAHHMKGFTAIDPVTGEELTFEPPPPPTEAASLAYAANKSQLEVAAGFVEKCQQQVRKISEIKLARLNDPVNNPEPCFNGDVLTAEGVPLRDALSATDFCVESGVEVDAQGRPIRPLDSDFNPYVDIITLSGIQPPLAKRGQFFYSKTGMYYDVYGEGLHFSEDDVESIVSAVYFDEDGKAIPGTGVPENSVKWLLNYNPNLGGRGTSVSLKTFKEWTGTVFDQTQVDESPDLHIFYNNDHFLQVLIDQRNKEIYDVSSHLTKMIDSGDYTTDSALYLNQRQNLESTIATHKGKINKRKKQIQILATLGRDGANLTPGNIPINDFSLIESDLVAVERRKQEKLIFNPGDVSGMVLPISPKFINSDSNNAYVANDLMLGQVGIGSILSSDQTVSGTEGTILSLTDQISTKGLVAIYNFLDTDMVKPDSGEYPSINCATSGANQKPAQLVASSIDSLFPSGLGIPYFRGLCTLFSGMDGNPKSVDYTGNQAYLYSPYRPYGYARLQSGWDDIDSLFYKRSGFSFQTWVHVPDLASTNGQGWAGDQSVSALHRVVLGCENRGGSASSLNSDLIVGPIRGDTGLAGTDDSRGTSVRGLLLGFTRDRRFTQNGPPSNNPEDNNLNHGLSFYMAPTQSLNTSCVTFLNVSASTEGCVDDKTIASNKYYGAFVDVSTTVNDEKFADCSSSFKLVTVTVDYGLDKVTMYCNQEKLLAQSTEETFGISQTPPRIPSEMDSSSFLYTNIYEGVLPWMPPRFPPNGIGQQDFWYWDGPQPDGGTMPLTPWIIGGGYTDGMTVREFGSDSKEGMNFLGSIFGGRKSGLHGFLGSIKLYNRAITSEEVIQNYNAQKGFFENIQV